MQHHHLAAFAILTIAAPASAQTLAVQVSAADARNVLDAFTTALEQREVRELARLFTPDAAILEGGRYEGPIGQYLDHHLGPELAAFESFEIKNRKVDIQVRGDVAWAREEYGYTIRAKGRDGVIERRGVSTAVLVRRADAWRIAQLHLSSRAP